MAPAAVRARDWRDSLGDLMEREPDVGAMFETDARDLSFLRDDVDVLPMKSESVTFKVDWTKTLFGDLIALPETLPEQIVGHIAVLLCAAMIGICIGVCIQAGGAWL